MEDQRSRKVAFLCHCLINQNSKVEGVAGHPGMVAALVELLGKHGIGIVQLPCPEAEELGIGRPVGDDTKEQYDTPSYRETCSRIAEDAIDKVGQYQGNGYAVTCILGVDGSPSCGVKTSPVRGESEKVPSSEPGIFIEILLKEMRSNGVVVPVIGIPESGGRGPLAEALRAVEAAIEG